MSDSDDTASDWWASSRWHYNGGLVVAGILAFIAYVIVGETLVPAHADFEITIFTTIFQGIGYLVMLAVANVLYFLGPISEGIVRPWNRPRFRQICYRLGFWFSVLLPFGIPVTVGLASIFFPGYFRYDKSL